MLFDIENTSGYTVSRLMRKIGYIPHYDSFIRRIRGASYPRFHIYIRKKEKKIIINLHLDQKKSSYKGYTAHSADYSANSGSLVQEKERILAILKEV